MINRCAGFVRGVPCSARLRSNFEGSKQVVRNPCPTVGAHDGPGDAAIASGWRREPMSESESRSVGRSGQEPCF